MMMRLAIDPGDKHVGLAWGVPSTIPTTHEVDAADALPWIKEKLVFWKRAFGEVEIVLEIFVLYPGQDKRNVGNRMLTSEMIGKIKYVADELGIPYVEQGASIQKPTRAQLRGRNLPMVGRGPHQRSAELHWWYRELAPRKEEDARTPA